MPSVGSSLATVTAAASTCFVPDLRSVLFTCFKSLFPLWVVSQLLSSTGIGMSGREDRDPPDGGDDGRGGDRGPGRGGGSFGKRPIGRTRYPKCHS